MRYFTIAMTIALTLTISSSVCMTSIDRKVTNPKLKIDTNLKLTFPKHYKADKNNNIIWIPYWLNWVKFCSKKYNVDPYWVLGVFETESSNKYNRFRFGKMGKTFYGPAGIHKCFLNKWDISDPFINTEVGIRALSRYGDQKRALRKYNTSFNMAYYHRIKFLERKWRNDDVFSIKNPESLIYKIQ
jgi:hypothetical protein